MLHCRLARPKEYARIVRIGRESFDAPWTFKDVRFHAEHVGMVFVAVDDDRRSAGVLGFVTVLVDETLFEIDWLAVSPKYRLQGIASKMLMHSAAMAFASMRKEVRAYVHESNLIAQSALRRAGYCCNGSTWRSDGSQNRRYAIRSPRRCEGFMPRNRLKWVSA